MKGEDTYFVVGNVALEETGSAAAIYANEAPGSRVVVAEWLRRWTRNPLGSPRAGSNPADYGVVFFFLGGPALLWKLKRKIARDASFSWVFLYFSMGL